MTDLQTLIQQRDELERQINEARKLQKKEAIVKCRQLIGDYDLSVSDLFTGKLRNASTGVKVAPKYKNPLTGETWTGRGKPPKWIQDQNREAFLIA